MNLPKVLRSLVAGALLSVGAASIAAPAQAAEPALDYEAYVFPYFVGESTPSGEKIYLAASQGNNPLAYDTLNGGQPILTSTMGEQGLRDPFIIRSHDGEKFYMLATDLRIYGGNNFSEAQESGSKYLAIWESPDLVNWSEQRMVKVSSDYAGNTWAPEAFYDEASGQYVVYWASNLYPTTDTATRDFRTSYNRMMYATTTDFVTFSEAKPWVDVKRGTGRGMIDATVVRDGDTFYRFIKDEADFTVRQEKSTDLMAVVTGTLPTTSSSPWSLVRERVGVGQPNPWGGTYTQGEGPTVFRDNENPNRWYMLIDQPSYHGGQGYMAFVTDDIASGNWTSLPDADLPSSPRHGTVIPITAAELQFLRENIGKEFLATSVAAAAVTTTEGTAPVLPTTVQVTYANGATRATAVDWDDVPAASYANWGTFSVGGTLAGGQTIRATANVTVRDAADPTIAFSTNPSTPNGAESWFVSALTVTATAADEESGVKQLELSTDGGVTWATTTGSSAQVALADGQHVVQARATDVSGNISDVTNVTVKVDTTAAVSRAEWNDTDRTVTIRAADATSRVARIEYQVGSATTWSTYTGPVSVGDRATTVRYRAVDVAGNVESANTLSVAAARLDATTTTASVVRKTAKRGSLAPVSVSVRGGELVPSGTVRVVSGSTNVGSATLSNGATTVYVDTALLPTGKRKLTVVYGGDENHATSQDTVDINVTK